MFSTIDYNKMVSTLDNETWTGVYNEFNDVNICYIFDKIIQNAINKSSIMVLMNAKNKRLKE